MSTNPTVSIGRHVQGQIHSCLHCRFFTRHLNLFERHVKRCSSKSSGPSLSRLLPAPSVCRNYKCGKCSFVSNKAKLFLYHQRQVHGENIAVYGCNECEYASRHKNKVVRHKRLVHKVVSSPDDILALEDHSMMNESEDVVAAHASETGNVNDHQVGDSELRSEDDNRAFDTKENNNWCPGNQFQTANQPSLPNEEIEAATASGPTAFGEGSIGDGSQQKMSGDRMATFLSKWTLPKVNVVDGLYRCKFCRYSNPHKWKIASHMRTSHSRKTSYKCPQCNFVTERKIEWCTHKTLHSGKAVYSCNECAYQTTMKRNFERHQERHLVNGPRRCSLCSYSSTGEGAIQRHMAEYHPPSPGKGGESLQDEFEDKQQDDVTPNPNDTSLGSHCSSSLLLHSSTPVYSSSAPPPPPFSSPAPPPFSSSALPYSVVLPSLGGSSASIASSVVVPSSACPEEQGPKGSPLIPLNSFRSFDIVQPPKSVQSSCAIAARSSESRWTCSLCPLGYKRAADLNRHMKRKHGVSLKDVKSSHNATGGSSRSILVNCSPVSSGSMPNSHSLFTSSPIFSNSSIMSSNSVMSNNAIVSNNSMVSGRSTITSSSPINFCKEDQPLNLSLKNHVQSLDADLEQAEVLDLSTKTNSNCFHPSSDVVAHFRCKFCSFTTKKPTEFDCHSLLHCSEEKKKSQRCLICGKSYDTSLDLTRHMTSMHQSSLLSSGGRLALSCDIQQDVAAAAAGREVVVGGGTKNISSGRSTPLKADSPTIHNLAKEVKCSSLLDTLEQSQRSLVTGLSCKFCQYVGIYPTELECHMKLHTGDKPLRCHFCAYKTIWKSEMKCHLLKHHSEEAENHGNLRELLDLTSQPGDDEDYDDDKECELRGFTDDSDKDNDYVDYNMNVEMNDSGFLFEAGRMALHSTSTGEKDGCKKLCKCPQCKFVSSTPLELKNHLEEHDNLRRFMCMHCGKRSSLLWDIRKHIRGFHPGVDMMIRELSKEEAKSLPSSDEGNQMIAATKDDAKGLTSDTKSMFAKEELHLKSLPKEEPMDVEKIAEQYANEVAAMFYGISGPGNVEASSSAPPLLQTWTGASSSQNAVAKKFGRPSKSLIMNRFRPFKCSECGRRSNWRWDLNKHIRASHPGAHLIELTETEAKATFLHRDIRERQQLMRMERTGGAKFKPYMCDSCGHRSNWKCDLNKHIKSLHPTAQVITLDEELAKDTIADYDALHAKLLKQEMCAERDVTEINMTSGKCVVAAAVSCVTVDSHKLKRFKCSACPYRSNFRSDVGRHIRHKHDKGTSRIVVMNEREAAETLKEYMETWARKKFVSSPSKRRSGGDRHRRMEQSFVDDFCFQQQSADGDNCRNSSSFPPTSSWLSSTEAGKGLENVGGGSDAKNCLIGVSGGKSEDSKACQKSSVVFARKKTEDASGGASSMKSLSCSICPYQTSKTGLLNIHKTYHRPNGRNKYKCRYCPYYVCASRLLHQHMRLHLKENSTEKSDGCTRADMADPVDAVAAVTEDAEEDPSALSCQESATRSLGRTTYCCLKCPYVSSNRNDYLYHRQFHRPRNTPAFKCDQCPYWVSQKRLLAQHAKVHSQEYRERHATSILTSWTTCVESKQEAKPVLYSNDQTETENEKSVSGNCDMVASCGLVVESDNAKNSHRISDWENVSDLENQDKYKDQCDISEHQLVDKFECRDCPFLTSNHSMYEEHLNQHRSGQKFSCSECNFSVGTLNLLRQHRKLHEGKDGMPSEKAAKLPNAEDDAHYNESKKAYCCDRCPYSNARRDHLLCHMKFHQIRSELQCSHCNYSVSRVHLLNQHLRVHGCGNGSTPSPSATREQSCGGSSRLRRARHRAEDLVPSESQTSFVVWMNQRQKQCAAQDVTPSADRDADQFESIGNNSEKWMKCVFMHNLQLRSTSPSGGEREDSKATGNRHSQAFAPFDSHSTTASQLDPSSTNT